MANPNTISWMSYQDVQIPQLPLKEQFDSLMGSGSYKEALDILKNNKASLEGRAFTADTIIRIVNGVKFLQGQFNTNVPVFLSDLANEYFALVDELGDVGEWADYIQYEPYNFVRYNDEIYLSISQSVAGEPPAENEYWVKLGLKGDAGVPGMDVNMRYTWSEVQDYKTLDLVVYGSDIYVAVKNNKGVTPGTDEATWKVFVTVVKGKFNVGINPPQAPEQNTIWFKTTVDPLVDTSGAIGQLYRYKIDGTWEKMYPATFFTLIGGAEKYAPIAFRETIRIPVSQWRVLNGKYSTSYENYRIKETSLVEVSCDSEVSKWHYREYCDLDMSIGDGFLKFTMPYKPINDPMILNITIQ